MEITNLGQYVLVLDDVLVCGQQHVEFAAAELRHQSSAQAGGTLSAKKGRDLFS